MILTHKFVVATLATVGCLTVLAAPAAAFWGHHHRPRVAYSPVVVASPVVRRFAGDRRLAHRFGSDRGCTHCDRAADHRGCDRCGTAAPVVVSSPVVTNYAPLPATTTYSVSPATFAAPAAVARQQPLPAR